MACQIRKPDRTRIGSKCPAEFRLTIEMFQFPTGFESGTRRGGRVIGLLAPLISAYRPRGSRFSQVFTIAISILKK